MLRTEYKKNEKDDSEYSDTSESSSEEENFAQQSFQYPIIPNRTFRSSQYLVIPWPIVLIILEAYTESLNKKKYEGVLVDISDNINSYNEAMLLIQDVYDRFYSSINKFGVKVDNYKFVPIKLNKYVYQEDEANNAIKLLVQKFIHSLETLNKYMKIDPSLK